MSNINWVCNKRCTKATLTITTFLDIVTDSYHNACGTIFIF
jgi:hypothetical protein